MKVIKKNHNDIFSQIQDTYLKTRSNSDLTKVYLVLVDYYKNLVLNYTHKKYLVWDDDTIMEKANDMATRIIERYLTKDSFKIDKLTAYAHFDFLKIMYGDKEYEMRCTTSYEEFCENIDLKDKGGTIYEEE